MMLYPTTTTCMRFGIPELLALLTWLILQAHFPRVVHRRRLILLYCSLWAVRVSGLRRRSSIHHVSALPGAGVSSWSTNFSPRYVSLLVYYDLGMLIFHRFEGDVIIYLILSGGRVVLISPWHTSARKYPIILSRSLSSYSNSWFRTRSPQVSSRNPERLRHRTLPSSRGYLSPR